VSGHSTPEERAVAVAFVIQQISEGKYLRAACKDLVPKRDPSTILGWINESEELSQQYARARVIGYSLRLEDMEEDADDLFDKASSGAYLDPIGAVQAFKAMTSVKKWNASKFAKGMFGDKVDLNLSGSVKTGKDFDLSKLTPEELATLRAIQAKTATDAPSND